MQASNSHATSQYLAPCMMFADPNPARHELIMPSTMPGVMKNNMTSASVAI